MLAIIGTVPDENFPLVSGTVSIEGDYICIQQERVPINRGTPALMAAAIKTAQVLKHPLPVGYLVGDIGLGAGSRRLYAFLEKHIAHAHFDTITFHYLQPDVDWHNRVLFAVQEMKPVPKLIADAGFMYAAKMSGQAQNYDLFTPDIGELAFLADEKAPHPFYTRGFILHQDNKAPELIARAYEYQNAAKYLLVKGSRDYIADSGKIKAVIDKPVSEALEAIGGTGDTLTGIVSILLDSGMSMDDAACKAAKINRLAGYYAKPTPATSIIDIIKHIPNAMNDLD